MVNLWEIKIVYLISNPGEVLFEPGDSKNKATLWRFDVESCHIQYCHPQNLRNRGWYVARGLHDTYRDLIQHEIQHSRACGLF